MTLTFNGQLFSFVFRYTEGVQNPRKPEETCKETRVIIRQGTGKEAVEVAHASSYCALGDPFCRQCGRLKAFTRVLKTMHLDRAGRAAFWSAYSQMINGKWR